MTVLQPNGSRFAEEIGWEQVQVLILLIKWNIFVHFVLYDSLDERLWSLKLPKSGTMPLKNRSLARGVKLVVNCSSKVVHKCLVRQPV